MILDMCNRLIQPTCFALLILVFSHGRVAAQRVTFDLPRTIACTVTTGHDESSAQAESSAHVSASIPISVILSGTHKFDVTQCEFEVRMLDAPLPVVDHEPKTTLVTDIQGAVSVSEESGQQAGHQLGGGGNLEGVVHAEASLSSGHHDSSSTHFEQLPARELLTTAGTIHRGTGVFFKLRKTSQNTLQGIHSLTITWESSAAWRAGTLRVLCRSTLQNGSSVQTQPSQSFLVPLYRTGDQDAQAAAEQLVDAEHLLLRLARSRSEELQRAQRSALVPQLARAEPALPKDWLERALWRRPEDIALPFETALPEEIRAALREYQKLRAAVGQQLEDTASNGA